MKGKFTSEQIQKARACKSIQEFHTFAKENGFALTEAEAKNTFARLHPECHELADDELQTIVGGCGGSSSESNNECSHPEWKITRVYSIGPVNGGLQNVWAELECTSCKYKTTLPLGVALQKSIVNRDSIPKS